MSESSWIPADGETLVLSDGKYTGIVRQSPDRSWWWGIRQENETKEITSGLTGDAITAMSCAESRIKHLQENEEA